MVAAFLSAVSEALARFFSWREASVNHQAETEVLQDKKDLEKACNFAELAIELVENRGYFMRNKDEKKFIRLVKGFRKYK